MPVLPPHLAGCAPTESGFSTSLSKGGCPDTAPAAPRVPPAFKPVSRSDVPDGQQEHNQLGFCFCFCNAHFENNSKFLDFL